MNPPTLTLVALNKAQPKPHPGSPPVSHPPFAKDVAKDAVKELSEAPKAEVPKAEVPKAVSQASKAASSLPKEEQPKKQRAIAVKDEAPASHAAELKFDSVKTYLREIGRVPLLSGEQEITYGNQVQQLMTILEAKELLTNQLDREPTLQEWAENVNLSEAELNQAVHLGQRAKKRMIEANLRLVVSVAKKYQNRGVEFLDLIQEGGLGLERGVEKFDPGRGFKFSTYAYWWITQSITRAIAQQSRAIRLPIHITEKLNKIKKVQRQLAQQLGRSPKPAEIAEALGLETAQIRDLLLSARHPMSLDKKIGQDEETPLGDLQASDLPGPAEYAQDEFLKEQIREMLCVLTEQQRVALTLRFGLDDGQERSLAEVGKLMDVSRERIRQLQNQAFQTIRSKYRKGVML
jgi:RNA polymerase nonessential primary-like sigma factor